MKKIFVLTLTVMLSACGNNNNNKTRTTLVDSSTSVGLPSQDTCAGTQMLAQVLSDDGALPSRETIGDLISASLDPDSVGDIEGVELSLNLSFDRDMKVVSNRSQFHLTIRDSYVGEPGPNGEPIEPIEILHTLGSTLSGSWNAAERKLNLVFEDQYGRLVIEAEESGDALIGTISFENFKSWDGSAPRSGILGSIAAKHCQFQ